MTAPLNLFTEPMKLCTASPEFIHCIWTNLHEVFTAPLEIIHEIFADIFIEIFTEVFTEISTAPLKIFTTHPRGVHKKFISVFT